MRGYRAAAYAADGKTATRFCCDGFTCNTCGKNTGSYQEWDSNGPAPTENSPHGRTTTVTGRIPTKLSPAHTYTCPCTNGQLIGIVINYTVGDTTGSVTLTTP